MTAPRTATPHPSLAVARTLEARDITRLAETYRAWSGVLAAAVDALHLRRTPVDARLASALHDALADNGNPVPATDLEDAAMALWLFACADRIEAADATTDLLREPFLAFDAARADHDLRLTA